MPFASIGGISVAFQAFSEREPLYAGEEARSFNNSLLSTFRNPKRRWTGQTRPYVHTEFASVRAAVLAGASVVCSGDAFQGGSFSCRVKLTEMPYERAKRTTTSNAVNALGYEVVYNLDIEEI